MRLHEFSNGNIKNQLETILKNLIGSAEARGTPASFNWQAIDNLFKDFTIDYYVFDKLFQSNQQIFAPLVSNYNSDGLEVNVPGVSKETESGQDAETSQDKVNDIAAANAEQNLN